MYTSIHITTLKREQTLCTVKRLLVTNKFSNHISHYLLSGSLSSAYASKVHLIIEVVGMAILLSNTVVARSNTQALLRRRYVARKRWKAICQSSAARIWRRLISVSSTVACQRILYVQSHAAPINVRVDPIFKAISESRLVFEPPVLTIFIPNQAVDPSKQHTGIR